MHRRCGELINTEMRRHRRDRRDLGPGGLHPPNVAVQIFGEPGAILGLDILKQVRRGGIRNHAVERKAVLLASLGPAVRNNGQRTDNFPARAC